LEHPAQRRTIDDTALDAEADDAPAKLVHHDQNPMGSHDRRFAQKQRSQLHRLSLLWPRKISHEGPPDCDR
jgi:hypothetical protein